MTAEIAGLVDTERGMISRRIVVESEIYEAELRQIFARCWLFQRHDSQIQQPGDFITRRRVEDREPAHGLGSQRARRQEPDIFF